MLRMNHPPSSIQYTYTFEVIHDEDTHLAGPGYYLVECEVDAVPAWYDEGNHWDDPPGGDDFELLQCEVTAVTDEQGHSLPEIESWLVGQEFEPDEEQTSWLERACEKEIDSWCEY